MKTRCESCGRPDHEACLCEGYERITIKPLKERQQCKHDMRRVYGVKTWKYLCVKCGGMIR